MNISITVLYNRCIFIEIKYKIYTKFDIKLNCILPYLYIIEIKYYYIELCKGTINLFQWFGYYDILFGHSKYK